MKKAMGMKPAKAAPGKEKEAAEGQQKPGKPTTSPTATKKKEAGGGGGMSKFFTKRSNSNRNLMDDESASNHNDGMSSSEPDLFGGGSGARKAEKDKASNFMRNTAMAPMMAGKAVFKGGVKVVQGGAKAVQGGVLAGVNATQNAVDKGITATTNVVKDSANTVVSGSKFVVGGTASVVEFGGKTVFKGVKGITKTSATMIGYAPRNKEEKKSKWELGVETIESLLEPGSATFEAMTPEQRKGLLSVKKLLITGPGGQDKTAYIPRDLIQLKKSFGSKNVTGGKRLSSNYILQEYAGVNNNTNLGQSLTDLDISEEGSDANDDDDDDNGEKVATSKPDAKKTPDRRFSHESVMSGASMSSLEKLDDANETMATFVPNEFKTMSKDDKIALYNMLSWDNINKWDFNIFNLTTLTKGKPLLFMGWAILGSPYAQSAMAADIGMDPVTSEGYPFMYELMIPPNKLCEYLRVIEGDYRANPYHNNIHAADVLQSLHTLIQASLEEDFLKECSNLHLFTILLAAVIHDVDHPGKTNAFHTSMRTELAVMYNDRSVLENWHAARAFARMLDLDLTAVDFVHSSAVVKAKKDEYTKDCPTNILCNASPEQFKKIRSLIIEAVLHTDMTKHFEMVNSAKGLLRQDIDADTTWKVLMFMLHMADISGQAKGDPLFKMWTTRCMDEFFAQGDEERSLGLPISPNCDRKTTEPAGSQVGFIKFVVEPAYEVLGMFIPFVEKEVVPQVHSNLEHWLHVMENLDDSETKDEKTEETPAPVTEEEPKAEKAPGAKNIQSVDC